MHARTPLELESSADDDAQAGEGGYDAWVGRVIDGRYELEEVLGEGGMGAVFAARHVKLRRRVALKVIHREHAGNEEIVQRFEREVAVTAKLEHANIVNALDSGTMADGGVYLVMELIRGPSLSESMKSEGSFEWRRAAEIGAQIADALRAAHRVGIVHRDLKPDNVVLVRDDDDRETIKLLDFGIAHISADAELSSPAEPLTRVGTVLGTVGYMAPEQCLGQPVDARTDLYTLGILLWEMIAGRTLFDDPGLTLTSFVSTQLSEAAPAIADVASDLPPEFAKLVDRLLAPKRDDRPESAELVRDELRMLIEDAVAAESFVIEPESDPAPAVASRAADAEPQALERPVADRLASVAASLVERALSLPRTTRLAIGAGTVLTLGLIALVAALGSSPEAPVVPSKAESAPRAAEAPEPAPEAAGGEVEMALTALLRSGPDWRARHDAARTIFAHEPRDEVPEIALALARLEASADCAVRIRAVEQLGRLGDGRALEPLRRHGRGRGRRRRCGRRFRAALDRALSRIRRATVSGEL